MSKIKSKENISNFYFKTWYHTALFPNVHLLLLICNLLHAIKELIYLKEMEKREIATINYSNDIIFLPTRLQCQNFCPSKFNLKFSKEPWLQQTILMILHSLPLGFHVKNMNTIIRLNWDFWYLNWWYISLWECILWDLWVLLFSGGDLPLKPC